MTYDVWVVSDSCALGTTAGWPKSQIGISDTDPTRSPLEVARERLAWLDAASLAVAAVAAAPLHAAWHLFGR